MPLPAKGDGIYRFGAFELASGTGELRKNGLRLKLQDQPVKLLVLLLENSGEVVSREQIQERLWAGDVHVDYENAINSAVRKLREVLIDTSENPRFVETLARRGYRFVAPVTRVSSGVAEAPVAVPVATGRKLNWIWPGVALVAVAGAAFWLGKGRPEPTLQAVPLTSYPGYEQWPSFSPDGNQVAFTWNGDKSDHHEIYVKLIGSVKPLRLTTSPASDAQPVWSPDGRSIAFARFEFGGSVTILLIPALGGAEREVARLGKGFYALIGGWSPDGRRLLIAWRGTADEPSRLYWVSVDNGEKQRLTSPSPGMPGDQWCSVSPDGRTIAFTRAQGLGTGGAGSIGDIYTLALTSHLLPKGEPRRLTFDNAGVGRIAWTADSREIVFSSSRGGPAELWRMPVSGSEKPRRLELGDDVGGVSIAGRSNRLAYVRNVAVDTNIWRVDLSDPTLPATSIIASTRSDTNGQYSPDGWRIVFRSARSGRFEIWACNSDGSEPVQLTTTALGALPGSPRWSPDGSLIAFDAAIAGIYQIFVMAANGGGQKQMTNGANSFRPSWSHDGKWLYFTSPRSGRDEIWKVPAGGGTAVQVTRNGGSSPVVSEDGTAIYYYTYRGKFMIMRAALDGSGETRIAEQGSYSRGASQNIAPAKGGFFTGLGYPTASCFRVSRTARLTVC